MTSFLVAVAVEKQQRLFVDNLMLGVQLADVSTRCSSHSQGKSEARCKQFIGVAVCACMQSGSGAEVEALARFELTLPPTSSWSRSSSLITRDPRPCWDCCWQGSFGCVKLPLP